MKHSGFFRLPTRALVALKTEPAEIWTRLAEKVSERREQHRPKCQYKPVPEWDRRLHASLGQTWPCPMCSEFEEIWTDSIQSLRSHGLQVGPMSFGPWNDGDAGLVRMVWCLTRHLQPERVVETGVAHGLTSRFVLDAMKRNGTGHLWSIDLPPLNEDLRRQVGMAVSDDLASRWTYILGSSRRKLPRLLSQLGQIDLFIHDSLHSERNVRFEIDQAWKALRPGGGVVVDDVDANWGFHSFNEAFAGNFNMVCVAEPLRPDHRRFNQKGLFGLVMKPSLKAA
jgi:hypothetical protein